MNFIISRPCPNCGSSYLTYDLPNSLLYLNKCNHCDYVDNRYYVEVSPGKVLSLTKIELEDLKEKDEKVKKYRDLVEFVIDELKKYS